MIIILHLYYQIRGRRSTVDETIKEKYSKILIKLSEMNGIQVEKFSDFRSPSSVGLRISNFFNLDKHKEKGMSSHSKHARKIWEEFAHDYDGLNKETESIISFVEKYKKSVIQQHEEEHVREGGIRLISHKERERNKTIALKKKRKIFKEKGFLSCEACGFNFSKFYGEHGKDFIECHHNKPLSEMMHDDKTFLSDLSLVCANCHRMLHRKREYLTIAELKKIIQKNKNY